MTFCPAKAAVQTPPPEFTRRVLLKALAATSVVGCAGEIADPDSDPESAISTPPPISSIDEKQQTFSQLVENDSINWTQASGGLYLDWLTPGGDWRDSTNAQNGTAPHATSTISAYGAQNVVFNAASLATRLLANNTGVIVRMLTSVGTVNISSRTGSQAPTLQIVTNTGTFNCPCTVSFWIDSSSNQTLLGTDIKPTALLKFDVSAVTGTVASATMTLRITNVFSGSFPRTLAVDYLDMPRLYYAPAVEVGGVVNGIAQTVAQDNQLGSHPSVLVYDDLTSDAKFYGASRRFVTVNLGPGGRSYEALPQYGLTAVVVTSATTTPHVVDVHRWSQPLNSDPEPNAFWRRPYAQNQELGHTHLFFRYLMWIGEDLYENFTELGMKLSAMSGSYEWSSSGALTNPPPPAAYKFAYRAWHSKRSSAAPHYYHFGTYEYDADHSIAQHSGVGRVRFPNIVRGASLRAGRWYCLEQELQLNTLVGNGAADPGGLANVNADGIERWWIDGVKVYEFTNLRIRGVKEANIQSIPYLTIYHGGMGRPAGPFTYKMAGVCVSTQYIGPPKKIA